MIEVKGLRKTYKPKKGKAVEALKGIDLTFEEKGLVFILGKSGSGKSTLLNLLGGLDNFDEGEIIIKGKSSAQFNQSDFDSYRNTFIGFIFQEYNILNDFTVGANIALAMELQGKKADKEELNRILKEVDLEGFGHRKPNELSGGQKQRVAIARALIKNPEIIMADEPTGALDSATGKQVFDTLKKLSRDKLVIVVSHDREFAEEYGERVIELADGEVISDIKKYMAKAADVSEGIRVIDNKIIHIKSGYTLTDKDLSMINDYLKKNTEADSFISIHGKTNDKIRRAVRIDEDGNQEDFRDTTEECLDIKEYDPQQFRLIRSKLPLHNSLKIAAGSLKKKPFRLVMTILLSTVAFTLFGLVNTMSSYDSQQAIIDSMEDSQVDYTAFTKQKYQDYGDYGYYMMHQMDEEDIKTLETQFPDMHFDKVLAPQQFGLSITDNLYDSEKLETNSEICYYSTSFSGLASINQDTIDNMNYTLKGRLPEKDNEIMITEYIAETFLKTGYRQDAEQKKEISIKASKDLLEKTITINNNAYTIVGILDTNFNSQRYGEYKEDLKHQVGIADYIIQSEMFEVRYYSYHALCYTTPDNFEAMKELCMGSALGTSDLNLSFYQDTTDYEWYDISSVVELSELLKQEQDSVIWLKEDKTLAENEIILPLSALSSFEKLYYEVSEETKPEEIKNIILKHKDTLLSAPIMLEVFDWRSDGGMSKTIPYKVVGVYASQNDAFSSHSIVYDGFYETYKLDANTIYSAALSNMPKDSEKVQELVAFSLSSKDGVKYTLKNCTSYTLEEIDSIILELKKPFLYIGIFFAIFAAFMLMNFISISISYRKKEIGILRAVGARGADVFKIFFNESLIIAGINWLLASAITGIAISVVNTLLHTQYRLVITILHFGIIQIALILIISIAVAFVASFFPVYRVSRKKPIEAIRKAD